MSYKPNEKLVHKTIQEVTTGKKRNLVEIAYDLIYEEVKTLTDSKDSTTTNEQAFYSPDYGKITHRQILKICKTPFRGEPGRIDSGKIDNESSCQEFHLR